MAKKRPRRSYAIIVFVLVRNIVVGVVAEGHLGSQPSGERRFHAGAARIVRRLARAGTRCARIRRSAHCFRAALHDAQSQESPHGVDAAYYRTAGATLNVSNSGVMVAVPNSPHSPRIHPNSPAAHTKSPPYTCSALPPERR